MEQSIADMTALMDHLDMDKAIVGGLSLGGYTSLSLLCRPSRTLCGPADHRLRPGLPEG